MIHLFKSALARAFTWSLVAVLVGGLLLGALRLALPYADGLRGQVAAMVGERLGLQVQLGALEVRLRGWTPQLRFRDARLLDPGTGHTQLALDRLGLDLDLTATLRSLKPQIGALTLIGARLLVRRLADGRLLVAGIGEGDGSDGEDLSAFLQQGGLRLEAGELTWVDEGSAVQPLVLSGVSAWVVNADERHRLALRAEALNGAKVALRLVADLSGDAAVPGGWGGRAYLAFTGGNLAPLVRSPLPEGLRLATRGARLEAWARLEGGALTQAQGRVDLADLELARDPPGRPPERLVLHALGGDLEWQRQVADEPTPAETPGPPGWRLDLRNLSLVQQGAAAWAPTELALVRSTLGDGSWELRGGMRQVRLGQVMDLVQAAAPALSRLLPLEGLDAFDHLLAAHPDAALHDLAWRLGGGPDPAQSSTPTWALRGRAQGLTSAAAGPFPGVRGLDIAFDADQTGGRLTLAGSGLVLDLPRLLRAPLALEHLAGDLAWRLGSDGRVHIESSGLAAKHLAVDTLSRFSLCLPAGGGAPFLDLRGHFGEGDASKARDLIPVGILKHDLVHWLDEAVIAGQVPSGALHYRGQVDEFPFRGQEGRLEVVFDVRGGEIQFLPDWPHLTELDGQVLFVNQRLDIALERGRIYDSAVTGGTAWVDDLFNTRTLEVRAAAEGPLSDGLRILRESPLARGLGPLAKAFDVSGGMRLDLDLGAPLQRGLPLRLDGRVDWAPGARVALKGTPVDLRDPSGTLAFDTDSLTAEGIKAQLWGAPVRLDIATLGAGDPAERRTRVRARGTTPTETLATQLPSPLWTQVQGTPTWDLELQLRNADVAQAALPIGFELTSDLKRVAVRLPAPLGKTAAAAGPLRLAGRLTPGTGLALDATYVGAAGHLDFAPRPGAGRPRDGGPSPDLALTGGRIDLGGTRAGPNGFQRPGPAAEGLWLNVDVPALDGDDWQAWWRREGPALTGAQGKGRGQTGPGPLRGADIKVGRLTLGGVVWEDLGLKLSRAEGSWAADLRSAQATGTLRLPDDPRAQPLVARLSRLDIQALAGGEADPKPPTAERAPSEPGADPSTAPALDLEVARLDWGTTDLGHLTLTARPRPEGLDIAALSLVGPLGKASGSGAWTQAGDAAPVTRLALEGETPDLGELLRRLEFASAIEHAPAKASLSADWPGGPGDFALAGLDGRMTFEVGAGGLLKVEPGVGRMLGILNIGALQRRLSLDFSDLFGQGYRFESIIGDLALARGEARIDGFEIQGPAADIAVTGQADLKARRFDQLATVTPKISTGVAVASAVVGGPLVGAAVYLVDRVTGGAIDSIGRYQYRITGPWDDPQISPVSGKAAVATDESGPAPSALGAGPDAAADPTPAPSKPAPAAAPKPAPQEAPNPFLH